MPFVQPRGIQVAPCNNSVSSIANKFNTGDVSHDTTTYQKKSEVETSCQVKNDWIKSSDDSIHIFTKTWRPVGTTVQAVIVFIHDIVEHCERYQPLFAFFAGKGIEVQSFDLPGFGETGARADAHGITGGYDVLIKEIDSAIERASTIHPTKPLFLMGHGMGGALVLNYVCGLGQRIASLAGIISSSPYLKPTMVGAGARFPRTYNRLGKWYPNISVGFQVSPEELTRDCVEQERHHGDGLIRDSVSLRCLGDMIYQGQKIMAKRWKRFPAPLPTLLLHGTDDPISSYQATSALSTLLLKLQPTNFVFKSWKGNKHDPHWDIDAVSVRSEYIHWIWNNSRHFVRLPLEPDVNKSAKSKASNMANKKDKKDKKAGKKADKADQNRSQGQEPSNGATHIEPAASSSSKDSSTQPVTLSGAEPEVIQDLAQLRRQQKLRVQRAMEKRQEYNLSETGQEPVSTIAICPSKGPAPTDAAIASTLSVSDPHKMSETKHRAEPAGLNIPMFNIAGRSQEVLAEAVLSDSNDIPAASSIVLTETQSVDSIIIPKLENNSAEGSKRAPLTEITLITRNHRPETFARSQCQRL